VVLTAILRLNTSTSKGFEDRDSGSSWSTGFTAAAGFFDESTALDDVLWLQLRTVEYHDTRNSSLFLDLLEELYYRKRIR